MSAAMLEGVVLIDADQRAAITESLSEEIIAELIEAFWEDVPGQFESILHGLADPVGHAQAEQVLHTVKGAGSSLGYAGLAAAAHELRAVVRAGEAPAPWLQRFRDVLEQSAVSDGVALVLGGGGHAVPLDGAAERGARGLTG